MPFGSILIVQENGTVARFLNRALSYFGYRVIRAADGHQARIFFDRHAPELMLMLVDTVLPDASGFGFVQDLPTRLPRIPVIFVSGLGEFEDPTPSHKFPVMQKPFTVWALIRAVRAAIARFYLDATSRSAAEAHLTPTNALS
jgi:two-component system, OmpR family, response regulator